MELLNSDHATAIKGGNLSGCDSAHAVIINCYVQLCSLIPPTPTPHKTRDILNFICNMKHYFLVVFLFVGMVNIYATDIISSLDITIPPLEDGVFPHKRRAVFIEQNFKIKNMEQDSICFTISPNNAFSLSFLSQWESFNKGKLHDNSFEKLVDFFQFKVVVNGIDQSKQIHYANGKLTIPVTPQKHQQIKICYRFICNNSQIYAGSPKHPTAPFVRTDYCYDSSDKAWYFTIDNITWKYIKIYVPHNENIEILSNYKLKHRDYTYCFDFTRAIEEDGLEFFIIEKDYCIKKSISSEHTKLNFYSQKYFDIDTLLWKPINVISPSEERVEKDAQATLEMCEQVRSFFNDPTDKTINVFKCNAGNMCFATVNKSNQYLVSYDSIFFDSEYYNISKWQHEYVHCFIQYPQRDDSVYYFFDESMTVFLSLCIDYINRKQTMEDIDLLMDMYGTYLDQNAEVNETPIFNINYNCRIASEVIYYKGPYMIYLFAKRIGFDNFMDIIRKYYTYIRENSMTVTIENFEKFFKQNGVSESNWEYFISLLS